MTIVTGDNYTLYCGDCLDILPALAAGNVDAVITDPPYGTTACHWDSVIPFEPMWAGIKHVLKPRGAAVLFGTEPFSSLLRISNLDWYKHDWIWDKGAARGHLVAKKRPMQKYEIVSVFGNGAITYNPKLERRAKPLIKNFGTGYGITEAMGAKGIRGMRIYTEKYPQNIVKFFWSPFSSLHPTQKPVTLMEYLIETYTNPGDTVLDFTMGSGTTGVACMRTGRRFIGIELDPGYFKIAEERIRNAAGEFVLTEKEKATGQLALFGE